MDEVEQWLLDPDTTFEEIDRIANGEEDESENTVL